MTNLPFDPETVTIQDLPGRLEEDDVDEETAHALQREDARKGAAAVYERRIDALRESQDPDAAANPEPEDPEPEASRDTDEDRARGYRITQWAGHPNYECLDCPFKHLDESKVIRHRAIHP